MNSVNSKIINYKEDFQSQVLKAVQILADPVVATLGPDGKPILLERESLPPLATKDGVTVAREVNIDDPSLKTIIEAIKEAANNTNKTAGDGTTTAILLTRAFIQASQAVLTTNAITPQKLADSLQRVTADICEELKTLAIKINTSAKDIKNVALISSNGDKEIANCVTDAIDAVGEEGVVSLVEGGFGATRMHIEEGFSINRGFSAFDQVGIYLINSKHTREVIYQQAAAIIYDGIVDNADDFYRAMENIIVVNGEHRPTPIVVFAHDFAPPVVKFIIQNVMGGKLQVLPVKVPPIGAKYSQSEVMEDLATLTGGKVLYPGKNIFGDIKGPDSEYLGGLDRIVSSAQKTLIFGGMGSPEEIKQRTNSLKEHSKSAESEWEQEVIKERIGRLVGAIAVIEVGGATDFEMKEKKDRIEDALCATRAALEDGVVPGGGTALLKAFIEYSKKQDGLTFEDKLVLDIFEKIAEAPLRQIITNTEKVRPDVVIDQVVQNLHKKPLYGYNARAKKYEPNMIKAGVIDPLKVVLTALTNASSIAATLLRCGGSIVLKPQTQKQEDNFYSQVNPDPQFMP